MKHIALLLILLSSFMITSLDAIAEPTLNVDMGYIKKSNDDVDTHSINPIRLKAIEEASTQLGARGALAWRSQQINLTLHHEATRLDRVFNFNKLMIHDHVLPPVIQEGNNSINLANSQTLRMASKIYKILSPAKFVTTPPTWRNYLWMNFSKPSTPDTTLLPKSDAEASAWNHYFNEGWAAGIAQANSIFKVNLSRLKRDYQGIVLYKTLLAQKMVSRPYVAKARLGVTGNGNEIRINDQVKRITANSELQTNPNLWSPVITR